MQFLAISGSLRAASSNTALLHAAKTLAPAGVEVVLYEGLGSLPHFNPDMEAEPPAAVQALRKAAGEADALLICSPEYAHGIAGSMKNLLDWLVGSVEFPGKPVAIINISARSAHADAQMREVLTTMSAKLVPEACILLQLPRTSMDRRAIAGDPEVSAKLSKALAHLADASGRASGADSGI